MTWFAAAQARCAQPHRIVDDLGPDLACPHCAGRDFRLVQSRHTPQAHLVCTLCEHPLHFQLVRDETDLRRALALLGEARELAQRVLVAEDPEEYLDDVHAFVATLDAEDAP